MSCTSTFTTSSKQKIITFFTLERSLAQTRSNLPFLIQYTSIQMSPKSFVGPKFPSVIAGQLHIFLFSSWSKYLLCLLCKKAAQRVMLTSAPVYAFVVVPVLMLYHVIFTTLQNNK